MDRSAPRISAETWTTLGTVTFGEQSAQTAKDFAFTGPDGQPQTARLEWNPALSDDDEDPEQPTDGPTSVTTVSVPGEYRVRVIAESGARARIEIRNLTAGGVSYVSQAIASPAAGSN